MSNYQRQQQNHDQQQTAPLLVANHPSSSEETPITTDIVQKYLDENKRHILAILDKQAERKFEECAIHQEKLRDNLVFLATIADTVYPPPAPIMQEGTASTMQPQHHDQGQQSPPAAATDTDTEDAAVDFRVEKQGNLASQQSASTMQPQRHDHGQQLESTLHHSPLRQQIQMTQPSILGQSKFGTPPAHMQTARRTPTLLNHMSRTPNLLNHMSSTLHQQQQFLHEDSSNSGYTSIGTCSTPQLDMHSAVRVNADSLNISSGNNAESPSLSSENFLDLLSRTDLTRSSSGQFNMGLNVDRPHLDHHAAGANTTTDQGESEFAGLTDLDLEYASFLDFFR